MGIIVISSYRPKPGKYSELLEVIRTHVPILRELGMATDRDVVMMKSKSGTIIEVFEWESQEAIKRAHEHARVHKMWKEFEACCDYEILGNIEEAKNLFSEFEPLN